MSNVYIYLVIYVRSSIKTQINQSVPTISPVTTQDRLGKWQGFLYWVDQKVHSGFSIPSHRKTQMNFLANPILIGM